MNKSIIRRLLAVEVISQSVAIYSLYVIMFSERGGLTPGQVGIVLGAFSLSTLLFEVPTGALADLFSRKWSLVLSKISLAATMITWLFFPSFEGYLLGAVLMGLSESMASGAQQAYLYESLDNKNLFAKYNSRLWAAMMSGFMLGAGIAALLGAQYEKILILSAVSPLVGAIIAMTLPTDKQHGTSKNIIKPIMGGLKYIVHSKKVLYGVFSILTLKALVDVLIEYVPQYYRSAGAPTRIVPLLLLAGNVITVALLWHSHTLASLIRKKEFVVALAVLGVFIATRFMDTTLAIAGAFIYIRMTRILFVGLEGEFQHLLTNTYRATVGSIYSMGSRVLAAISYVLVGYFSNNSSILTPVLVFTVCLYGIHAMFQYKAKQKYDR